MLILPPTFAYKDTLFSALSAAHTASGSDRRTSTGSPANLDAGHPDKLYIHPGDVIRCEIAGIGSLTNPVEVRQDREERL